MSNQFIDLANPGIRALKPYQPGKSIEELQREFKIERVIKLASNENPLGPSPKAIAAAQAAVAQVALYPEGSGYDLKVALSQHLKVDIEQITLGNGSDNNLAMIVQTFSSPGAEIIVSEYGFSTFSIIANANHATPITVPAKNWGCDLNAMAAAITDKTSVIFLANPNNPTGTWVNEQELTQFLDKVPTKIMVVLDEAYYEYATDPSYPNSIKLLQKYPNVIATRTFSKVYALAGLRVGYSISHPDIADLLNRVRLPFNVNIPAQQAAIAAVQDQEHVKESLKCNQQGMLQLAAALETLGLEFIPSAGNFLTIDMQRAALPVYQQLLQLGVIVRPLMPYNMPNHLRVTVGTTKENEYFISALNKVLDK